jgi:hypothetical protein
MQLNSRESTECIRVVPLCPAILQLNLGFFGAVACDNLVKKAQVGTLRPTRLHEREAEIHDAAHDQRESDQDCAK